jgi:hypothetical protein
VTVAVQLISGFTGVGDPAAESLTLPLQQPVHDVLRLSAPDSWAQVNLSSTTAHQQLNNSSQTVVTKLAINNSRRARTPIRPKKPRSALRQLVKSIVYGQLYKTLTGLADKTVLN